MINKGRKSAAPVSNKNNTPNYGCHFIYALYIEKLKDFVIIYVIQVKFEKNKTTSTTKQTQEQQNKKDIKKGKSIITKVRRVLNINYMNI